MDRNRRSALVIGLVLILLGAWFLLVQLVPALGNLVDERVTWPLFIVAFGLVFIIVAALGATPGLAVPGCFFIGLGGLLYYQNATGNWESWAYAWTLFPAFVGVGIILSGLLGREPGRALNSGIWLIVISFVLFAVFASFLGGLSILGNYWPILLIALGVLLLGQSFFFRLRS